METKMDLNSPVIQKNIDMINDIAEFVITDIFIKEFLLSDNILKSTKSQREIIEELIKMYELLKVSEFAAKRQ